MAEANLWDVSPRMGLAEKTTEAHKTAKYWIQKYLSSESNTHYSSDININKLTNEYHEEENMQIVMETVGLLLSTRRFWTRQNTFLGNDVKATYFKNMKELLKSTFPHHYFFSPNIQVIGLVRCLSDLR